MRPVPMRANRQEEDMTKDNRTKLLQARVTPQVHAAVTQEAEKRGVPAATILRWALAEYIKSVEANDEHL